MRRVTTRIIGASRNAAKETSTTSASSSRRTTRSSSGTSRTRELVGQVDRDLGAKLDWIAVNHWNTKHPHIHVIVRAAPMMDRTW